MERKTSGIDSVKVIDEKQGIVEAFVNTMGVVDKDGDIISPNAFDKSITDNLPIPVLSGHNQGEVVGKVLSAMPVQKDSAYQLHATMQMNMETQSGREAYSNVAGEYVREWSIGFNMPEDGAKYDTVEGTPVRTIEQLDWVETSTVIRGASPDTSTISAKSDNEKDALPVHDTGVQKEADLTPAELRSEFASDTTDEVASDTELQKAKHKLAEMKLEILKSSHKEA